ncbi:hypothetical protein [uncultured Metabacillus sp.]|uniref:hypothetical protein n=1 Tax=uncultured Metabacillus sp. TaxID=2860135 RepID=UPI0026138B02|nr:hypothetical protein [uncultured Metabacillus sp.]
MLQEKENKIAIALIIMGWVNIASGISAGFIFGYQYEEFIWSIFLSWSIAGISSGLVLLALGEIVESLNNIRDCLKENTSTPEVDSKEIIKNPEGVIRDKDEMQPQERDVDKEEWIITENQKEAILKLYKESNDINIIPSPYRNFCIVEINGGKIEIIELKQNVPFVLSDFHWADIQKEIRQWYKEYKH